MSDEPWLVPWVGEACDPVVVDLGLSEPAVAVDLEPADLPEVAAEVGEDAQAPELPPSSSDEPPLGESVDESFESDEPSLFEPDPCADEPPEPLPNERPFCLMYQKAPRQAITTRARNTSSRPLRERLD